MLRGGPRLIQRGELIASLDRAAQAKVTLISGPAGSGKTLLLRAWTDGPGRPYRPAVVQVQRDQQDSQQFWLAVLSAIRQASGAPSEGEQLAATPSFNQEAIADRVRSELAERRGRTFLIIDDLHELTSREALTQLTRLLEKLPEHVHAILTTRRDLPLRLHKLRLAGELAEIRAADLRFTERETREFLATSGIVLSEGRAAELHQRTEGWAAGLRLAAISLASSPDRSDLSRSSLAATGRLPSTCLPKCWTASRPRSSRCFCVPPCSTASTASWLTC